MLVKPKFFVDPSSITCESLNGIIKVDAPDEDEYEPENHTMCFGINQDDKKIRTIWMILNMLWFNNLIQSKFFLLRYPTMNIV